MSSRIASLAERVRNDPQFLAAALEDYAGSEGLDRPGLAAALRVPIEMLPRLELCRRPRPERFRRDVEEIAQTFGARVEVLAEAVRHSDALRALRAAQRTETGWLAAARDREDGAGPRDQDTR